MSYMHDDKCTCNWYECCNHNKIIIYEQKSNVQSKMWKCLYRAMTTFRYSAMTKAIMLKSTYYECHNLGNVQNFLHKTICKISYIKPYVNFTISKESN